MAIMHQSFYSCASIMVLRMMTSPVWITVPFAKGDFAKIKYSLVSFIFPNTFLTELFGSYGFQSLLLFDSMSIGLIFSYFFRKYWKISPKSMSVLPIKLLLGNFYKYMKLPLKYCGRGLIYILNVFILDLMDLPSKLSLFSHVCKYTRCVCW